MSVPIDFEWEKWCLHLFSVTMNSVFINLTGKWTGIKSWTSLNFGRVSDQPFWSYMPLSGEKNYVSRFSQSSLIVSLSNL